MTSKTKTTAKPTSTFRLVIWHIFVSIVQSIILAVAIFVIGDTIWSFFGPHYQAPVANEEWLWSLTVIMLITLVITEILLWMFRIYKLFVLLFSPKSK